VPTVDNEPKDRHVAAVALTAGAGGIVTLSPARVMGPPPLAVPIEMAREQVWGAVAYARNLGFEPSPEFAPIAGHLGAWQPTGVVRFGQEGKPYFVQGIRDNAPRILRTLERSVGEGNFHYVVSV